MLQANQTFIQTNILKKESKTFHESLRAKLLLATFSHNKPKMNVNSSVKKGNHKNLKYTFK